MRGKSFSFYRGKLTREEALRRWNASKETKRKMVEKLENLSLGTIKDNSL